jgi:hypothetical protein
MPPLNLDEHAAKSIPDLIKFLSSLNSATSGSITGAQEESHRQAIQCLIEEKLTAIRINALNELNESINNINQSTTKLAKELDGSINKLNRSTTRLTFAGLVLSIIIAGAPFLLSYLLKK